MLGFIIWACVGVMIMGIGVFSFFSRKPMGFWANVKMFNVSDYKKYNHSLGKLLLLYGAVFTGLGTPLLGGQNSPVIIFSIIGLMIESIIAMVVYTQIIEKKYRNKK